MELVEQGRWWIGPNGERCRVIAGGADSVAEPELFDSAPPADEAPVNPPPPTAEEEAARLREDNARLRGENTALRETRREPIPPTPPPPPADAIGTEFDKIEKAYAAGTLSDAERTMRLGALGAESALARRDREQRETDARTRNEQARAKSGQKIAVYLEKYPGLSNALGPEMQRVAPHLRAVADEFGLETTDPRAQSLALERTFGPIDRSPHVDTREFERRRHPGGGGGGGSFAEEPTVPLRLESNGLRIFNKLLPEFQEFYLQTRGSKEAAIKTLEHADEHQMRKQGRFR